MVTDACADVVSEGLRYKEAADREFVTICRAAVSQRKGIEATLHPEVEPVELNARLAQVSLDVHHRAGHDQGALEGHDGTQRGIGGEPSVQGWIKEGSATRDLDVITAPRPKCSGSV